VSREAPRSDRRLRDLETDDVDVERMIPTPGGSVVTTLGLPLIRLESAVHRLVDDLPLLDIVEQDDLADIAVELASVDAVRDARAAASRRRFERQDLGAPDLAVVMSARNGGTPPEPSRANEQCLIAGCGRTGHVDLQERVAVRHRADRARIRGRAVPATSGLSARRRASRNGF